MIHRLSMAIAILALANAPRVAAQKGDSKLITAEDIAAHPDLLTADEVIRRIRPSFLRPAANTLAPMSMDLRATGRPERSLFVDGILQDQLDDLREILAKNVVEIRLMSPAEVSLVLGKEGHVFGAIAVKTRPRG